MSSNHFQSRFSAIDYLCINYRCPGGNALRDFAIGKVYQFFKATKFDTVKPGETLKVLDYGCGPVIAHVISAAGIPATEIVLAEFTNGCREAVQLWLDKDPSAWDWTPYIKYVVQTLEGNKDECEITQREENLRKSIKAVVPCDVRQDPPIAEGFAGPQYDIVMSILCLGGACETKGDYKDAIKKLISLVKPGGYLLLFCGLKTTECYGRYHIGGNKFILLGVSLEFVLESLREGGLLDVHYSLLPEDSLLKVQKDYNYDDDGFAFIVAKYTAMK